MNTIASDEVIRVLDHAGVEYELLPHLRTTTAVDEASAVGIPPRGVAKTLLVKARDGYVRAVIPASKRLDLMLLREHLDLERPVRLASELELAGAYPMFELGAVPPFGGPAGDRVVVDRRIALLETDVLEAGSHDESVRLRTRELLTLADATVADICAV